MFKIRSKLDKYNFCLLDTNFVSTILKSDFPDKIIDKERTQALFKKYINPKDNIICISPHTIKELQYNKVFDQFKKIFNIFPFIMLHSFAEIIELETKGHITKKEKLILTPIHRFMSFDLLDILEHKDTIKILEKTKENDEGIAEDTLDKYREYINLEGDDRKKKSNAWKITKKAIAEQYGVDETDVNHKKYPARVIFARNQIFKFCNATGKYDEEKALSDTNDLMIYAVSPYMDKIFAEASQADFLNQIKRQGMLGSNIEIYPLGDIIQKSQ